VNGKKFCREAIVFRQIANPGGMADNPGNTFAFSDFGSARTGLLKGFVPMKRLSLVAGFLALTALLTAQTTHWSPDANHSEVNFSVKHMTITNVRGHFGKVTGSLVLDPTDITKSTVTVEIDVTGVDTGVSARDNDLKSEKFFNVAQFPTAKYVSTSVAKSSDGGLTVNGNLTLHGVTKPVTLHLEAPAGPVDGPHNSKHMGFSGTTTIDRTAFGVGTSEPAAMVSNEVKLEIELDAVLQP
jgi:polyisoprenoid-binding protein YceI